MRGTAASCGLRHYAGAYTFLLLVILVKLYAVEWQGVAVRDLPCDDSLFLRLGHHIAEGSWLGPYTKTTLIKGPGYPLFIAMCHLTSIPLILAHQILYCLAVVVVMVALHARKPPPWWIALAGLILLANPSTYAMNNVTREHLYQSLCLLQFGLAAGGMMRNDGNWMRSTPWWIGGGVTAGWILLTREESASFLGPVGLVIAVWALIRAISARKFPGLLLTVLSCGVLMTVGPILIINWIHYGEPVITEITARPFSRACGNLQRIHDPEAMPFVPVSQKMRMAAYQSSPTFRTLQPYLDGYVGWNWARIGRMYVNDAWEVPELPGAVFVWALRDAISAAGHGETASELASFMRQVSSEIEQACSRNQLKLRAVNTGLSPVWREGYGRRYPEALLHYANYVLSWPHEWEFSYPKQRNATRSLYCRVTHYREEPASRGALPRRAKALEQILAIYRLALPWTTSTALVGILVLFIRRQHDIALLTAAALLAAVLRVALLAYIDMASFSATMTRYVQPIYPLLLLAFALALLACRPNGQKSAGGSPGEHKILRP